MISGSPVLLLLSGILIDRYGWRGAYMFLAAIVLAVALPVNLIFLRSPEKMKQKPLGWEKAEQTARTSDKGANGIDAKTARGSACFWLLFIAMIMLGTLVNGFKSFAPSFWQSNGMPALESSRYISIFMLLSTIATLVSGGIADKFGNKIYITYLHIAFTIGMALVIFTATNANPIYLYSSIMIMGITFGATGSYVPAFMTLIAFGAASLLLILMGLKLSPHKQSEPISVTQTIAVDE